MKKATLAILTVLMIMSLRAEPYPSRWIKFTLGDYIYDIESGNRLNDNDKARLLDICRTNVAKQVEIKIYDKASLSKQGTNGVVDILYSANTEFITNISFKLLKTESLYDSSKKQFYAIAYINIKDANIYYTQLQQIIYEKINSAIVIIENLISEGELIKASHELKKAKDEFIQSDDNYKWLLIYGSGEEKIEKMLTKHTELKQKLEQLSSYLSKNAQSIYFRCNGSIFDIPCSDIINQIKGGISELSCSFTDDSLQADWIIEIYPKATHRKKSNEHFVNVSITGNVYCVKKRTSYALSRSGEDSAPISERRAADIILQRDLLGSIINDIIEILKSK